VASTFTSVKHIGHAYDALRNVGKGCGHAYDALRNVGKGCGIAARGKI